VEAKRVGARVSLKCAISYSAKQIAQFRRARFAPTRLFPPTGSQADAFSLTAARHTTAYPGGKAIVMPAVVASGDMDRTVPKSLSQRTSATIGCMCGLAADSALLALYSAYPEAKSASTSNDVISHFMPQSYSLLRSDAMLLPCCSSFPLERFRAHPENCRNSSRTCTLRAWSCRRLLP
jgi:hypothetical protein